MKVNEVPQDITFYEDVKRACYALDNEGKYIIIPSSGWSTEEVVNGLAVDELKNKLEETRKEVIQGLRSPLAYHMEQRQMTTAILAKTVGQSLGLFIKVRLLVPPKASFSTAIRVVSKYDPR